MIAALLIVAVTSPAAAALLAAAVWAGVPVPAPHRGTALARHQAESILDDRSWRDAKLQVVRAHYAIQAAREGWWQQTRPLAGAAA